MQIRIKNNGNANNEKIVYEIVDSDENKIEINTAYLETTIKILKVASKKTEIRNNKAFEKFLENLYRATKYLDKAEDKALSTPNIIHRQQDLKELNEYTTKHIKYDKKAQALFTTHSGWYDNFKLIVEEIKNIFNENYEHLNNENELLYTATRIDSILEKYKKKPKMKTL